LQLMTQLPGHEFEKMRIASVYAVGHKVMSLYGGKDPPAHFRTPFPAHRGLRAFGFRAPSSGSGAGP
jgi:hypothetical protein